MYYWTIPVLKLLNYIKIYKTLAGPLTCAFCMHLHPPITKETLSVVIDSMQEGLSWHLTAFNTLIVGH